MSKILWIGVLAAIFVGCDTKSPSGPSDVTPIPTTTTTSIPGPGPTTTSTTTTSIPTIATSRTYVAFGPAPPIAPSQLTVVVQPLTRQSVLSSLTRNIPFIGGAADPLQSTVMGFYTTPNGGQGRVSGDLEGTLDAGTFQGTLTSETPECVAEREFGGTLDPQFLRWTGGKTLRNCKGDPLGFSSLVMLATAAPPPTSTVISSSTTTLPLTCSYSLSANSASIGAGGGTGSVGVTTTPSCGWIVQNFVPWITVQPTGSSGAGTVNFTVAANPGPPRSATLVIAGLPFVVNQGVVTTTTTSTTTSTSTTVCGYVLTPSSSPTIPVTGTDGSNRFTVTTSCLWHATTTFPWIQVLSPSEGTGNGAVNYTVGCNNTATGRTGTIRVGNGTFANFTITQAAPAANTSPCGVVQIRGFKR